MKTPLQTAARLVGALEDFVEREGALLRAGNYGAAAAMQERVNPLVAELCALGSRGGTAGLAPRVRALIARRREFLSGLAERREALGRERARLAGLRERLRGARPYGLALAGPGRRRLDAAV